MKFITIFKSAARQFAEVPDENTIAEMRKLIHEMRGKGVLVDTGGVVPAGASMRVRRNGNNVAVTDGPFTETKELVGGFAVLEVSSKDEALSWTRRFLEIGGDEFSEIHEVSPTPFTDD
ncbi:MAG: YciI family protein [Candidatus Baltobacteraceae bacterium]